MPSGIQFNSSVRFDGNVVDLTHETIKYELRFSIRSVTGTVRTGWGHFSFIFISGKKILA